MSNRSAFIIEKDPRYDVSDASRYGDLKYLFTDGDQRPSVWSNRYVETCLQRMSEQGFNAERDFFVVTGQQVPVALLVAHLVAYHETVNLLLFDASQEEYVHRMIT